MRVGGEFYIWIIVIYVVIGLICGFISENITIKRRMNSSGFAWGFFLGVLGIVVVALRPNDQLMLDILTSIKQSENTTIEQTRRADNQIPISDGQFQCSKCKKRFSRYSDSCPSCGKAGTLELVNLGLSPNLGASNDTPPITQNKKTQVSKVGNYKCSVCGMSVSVCYEKCPYCYSEGSIR